MAGERDPRMKPITDDAATNEELMAAALRAAGTDQIPPVVFRGNRLVGVLRVATTGVSDENRAAFTAATIDGAIASGEPVKVGIGAEFTGTFVPMDVTEAVRRSLEADPILAGRLQADMQQFPPTVGP